MKNKRKLFAFFLLFSLFLCLSSCQNNDDFISYEQENISKSANSKEIKQLKNFIKNSSPSNQIYNLHQWENATFTSIDSIAYLIEIPLKNTKIDNENYLFSTKYIFKNNHYSNRLIAKPINIISNKKYNPVFVYVFNNPSRLDNLIKRLNSKINNYSFKNIPTKNNSPLKRCSGGSGCPSTGSSFWNKIVEALDDVGDALKSIANAVSEFFSNWASSGTGTSNTGSYTLYEFENVIVNGNGNMENNFYGSILPQELFWLPPNTSDGEMYHFSQYREAIKNFDSLINGLHLEYPNVNTGYLLSAVLKYHLPSHLHKDINNGNIALVFNYINNQETISNSGLWNLLQDFIYRFQDTVSYNVKLNEALNNFNTYKKKILLTAIGFKASNFTNSFSNQELLWLSNNFSEAKKIAEFVNTNNNSTQAKTFAKGQIELSTIADKFSETDPIKIKLRYSPGKINGRDDQKYTHIATDGIRTYYKMEDGSIVLASPDQLKLNSDGNLASRFTSEVNNTHYYYIKPLGATDWSNYLIKQNESTADGLKTLFELGAQELALALGTYVIPVEDVKILIDGKDFDGQPSSRWLAAGLLVVEIVPGGKLLRAVKFIPASVYSGTGKFLKAITKADGGTTKLVFDTVNGIIDFGNRGQLAQVLNTSGTSLRAHHVIPWRFNDNPIVQAAAKYNKHWHPNDFFNGKEVEYVRHSGSHDTYDTWVRSKLRLLETRGIHNSPEQAYNELLELAETLKNIIDANPNTRINDLPLP